MNVLSRQLSAERSRRWSGRVGASDSGSARVRISYLLGNLTKSFNYRAVASHDEKTLDLSAIHAARRTWPTKSFATPALWAGLRAAFSKADRPQRNQRVLVEKYRVGADRENLHLQPGRSSTTSTALKTSSACRCTTCSRTTRTTTWARRHCRTAKSASSSKAQARTRRRPPRFSAKTGASSRPRTTRCGSTSASPRTSSSSARSKRTKRNASPATCSIMTSS